MGSYGNTKQFVGAIIEESLEDRSVPNEISILRTSVEPATAQHQTPWVEQWTLHEVAIPEDQAEVIAERLSRAIDRKHSHAWYADFRNEQVHFVVFRDRVFRVDRTDQEDYAEALNHGRSLGIPDHQLDFSPMIDTWDR